jgi:SAM-dependent methyltransferase
MKKTLVVERRKGILLDLGCGGRKQPNFVGMDKRKLPGVDIVHDLERFPYPIPTSSVLTCVCSHVLEHLKPWLTLDVFNEVWRIMKPEGQWVISLPYAGSPGFWQDPTHCNGFNQDTFLYFDPRPDRLNWKEEKQDGIYVVTQVGEPNILFDIYKPRPWKIIFCEWQSTGNMEIVLEKRKLTK